MSTAWANPAENAAIEEGLLFWDQKIIVIQFLSFCLSEIDPVRRCYSLALFRAKDDKANGRAAADGLLANPVRSERKQP